MRILTKVRSTAFRLQVPRVCAVGGARTRASCAFINNCIHSQIILPHPPPIFHTPIAVRFLCETLCISAPLCVPTPFYLFYLFLTFTLPATIRPVTQPRANHALRRPSVLPASPRRPGRTQTRQG